MTKPERIVSQLPNLTETLFALELDHLLAGRTDFCVYPKEATKVPSIGGIVNPNLEQIIALKPSMIFLQDTQSQWADRYKQLGIKPVTFKLNSTISDVYKTISGIGALLNVAPRSAKLIKSIKHDLFTVEKDSKSLATKRTLIVVGHEPGSLREIWAAGKESFHDELLEIAGGTNIIPKGLAAYPKLSKEQLLKAAPEVIIILSDGTKESSSDEKKEKALWQQLSFLPAVKTNSICLVKGDWLFIPGPRMAKIAQSFYSCLHPSKEAAK